MLEAILISLTAGAAGGWFMRNHVGNIATAAASAITAATIIHTGTPLDAAVKSAGATVAADVGSVLTAASKV